uniref:Helicase ATP-binding domain-containing protein n=1 Tax=viral metagenome TaxID=1070528 RepID=A0A6C0E5H1_9ZZZZ
MSSRSTIKSSKKNRNKDVSRSRTTRKISRSDKSSNKISISRSKSRSKDVDNLDELISKMENYESEISNQEKAKQFRNQLQTLQEKIDEMVNKKKYIEAIDYLNEELKNVSDRYLRNEILKIAENVKYSRGEDPSENNDGLNYPVYYDKDFSKKIYQKAEFYQNRLPKILPGDVDELVASKNEKISLAYQQRFLKNFMSRRTPYNGLLLFHGMGRGKTCASIAIAEAVKESVLESNQKIIIIAGSHFDKGEIFNIDNHRKGIGQCTGDVYLEELNNPELAKKCTENNGEACKLMKNKIDKIIKNTYTFYGALEWAKKVLRDLQKSLRGIPESRYRQAEIAKIKKMFNNSLIIIDEAHNIKDIAEKKSRIVPPVLMKVLEHADNLRLVLLTGTPMFNESGDLVSLLNYLLINDGRPILKESDIFKSDGSFAPHGKDTLIKYSRGYVSFLRGENPINYPIRLPASIHGTSDILTPDKWPKYDIYGNPLKNPIKHLEITGCPMSKEQEKVYRSYLEKRLVPDEEKTSAAYSSELQILNFIYQDMSQISNVNEAYGERGLNALMMKLNGKNQYQFRNPDDAFKFKGDNLKIHSSKIHKIMENIEKTDGLVFVYTEYENSGILPLAFALELAGYQKYRSSETPVLVSEHKERKYKGDYLIISGNIQLSKYKESYLAKKYDMAKEPVKVILATRAASEGLSLFGVREIHILNPWHNLNRLSQAIARGLRSWSHIKLPKEERNLIVYIYAATYGDQETVDQKIYREAENKAINIGIAEDVLRRNAVDCILNKEGNYYSEEDWGELVSVTTSRGIKKKVNVHDQPYSHVCHYLKDCQYKCYSEPSNLDLDKKQLDYSTYNIEGFNYEVNELIDAIRKVFKKDVILTLEKIMDKLPAKYRLDDMIVYQALSKMIKNNTEIYDKYNRPGYLIYRGNYYIYQPLQIHNPDLLVYQRSVPPPIRPNMLDLSEYVENIGQDKKVLFKKDQYQYSEVLEYVINQIKQVKEKSTDALFQTTISLTDDEVNQIVVDRLVNSFKGILLKNVLIKDSLNQNMKPIEKDLLKCLMSNIISVDDLEHNGDKQIYGYRLIENDKQIFYRYISTQNDFVIDEGNQHRIVDALKIKYLRLKEKDKVTNDLYGYLKFDKSDNPPLFKLRDFSKGDKKSIKGISCVYKSRREIYDHLKSLYNNTKEINNKRVMCDDIEVVLRRYDKQRKDGKRWFFNVEEYREKELSEEN